MNIPNPSEMINIRANARLIVAEAIRRGWMRYPPEPEPVIEIVREPRPVKRHMRRVRE